jgi:hypothetical protein
MNSEVARTGDSGSRGINALEIGITESGDETFLDIDDFLGVCARRLPGVARRGGARARMDARDPSNLARGLRDTIELVDRHSEVDDAHHEHENDEDGEREFHKGLATPSPAPDESMGAHQEGR